jgi:hypothetical protein
LKYQGYVSSFNKNVLGAEAELKRRIVYNTYLSEEPDDGINALHTILDNLRRNVLVSLVKCMRMLYKYLSLLLLCALYLMQILAISVIYTRAHTQKFASVPCIPTGFLSVFARR